MAFQALINRGSGVALDIHEPDIRNDGAKAQQWEYYGQPNQHWEGINSGGGFYWLRNQASGKALDVNDPEIGNNGAKVQQWEYFGDHNSQWQPIDLGGGWFWLRNRKSGKALDVHVYDIAKNGAKVQQWDFNGSPNQQWKWGGDTSNRFFGGPFEFDTDISVQQVCTLFERHRFARSRIDAFGVLTSTEKSLLDAAYKRTIRHSTTTEPGINARAIINGSQIWINFGVLFPDGDDEIAQTLIHEMMHCAGFSHPARRDPPFGRSCEVNPDPAIFDCPFDNGQYYGTPPLRAELCIAGSQSLQLQRAKEKAGRESCVIDEKGVATIHKGSAVAASQR